MISLALDFALLNISIAKVFALRDNRYIFPSHFSNVFKSFCWNGRVKTKERSITFAIAIAIRVITIFGVIEKSKILLKIITNGKFQSILFCQLVISYPFSLPSSRNIEEEQENEVAKPFFFQDRFEIQLEHYLHNLDGPIISSTTLPWLN